MASPPNDEPNFHRHLLATREQRAAHERLRYRCRLDRCIEILGGKCVECGSIERLQIDHVDPSTKSFTLSRGMNRPWPEILTELTKCQLLCFDHHKSKSLRESTGPRNHGTWAAYTRGKCRCQICLDFFNQYRRDRRAVLGRSSEVERTALARDTSVRIRASLPNTRYATDAEVQASAARMIEKHGKSLRALAEYDMHGGEQ